MNSKRNRAVSAVLPANQAAVQPTEHAARRRPLRRYLRVAAILVLVPLVACIAFTLMANTLWRGIGEGQPAPELSGQDLQGNVVRLSELQGRPVMLTFWSPDCFACREELPTLQAIAEDPSAEVVLLTVVSHLPAGEVQEFVDKQKLTFPVIVDEQGTIPAQYKVTGIPFTYFIRPDGNVDRAVIGAGEPGDLHTDLQRWLSTCKIDAPCTVKQ